MLQRQLNEQEKFHREMLNLEMEKSIKMNLQRRHPHLARLIYGAFVVCLVCVLYSLWDENQEVRDTAGFILVSYVVGYLIVRK